MAHPFDGSVQSVIDTIRVTSFVLGVVVAVLLLRVAVNPARRLLPVQAKFGCVAIALFTVAAVGTEINRLGHDMGYWRLPTNIAGLTLAICYLVTILTNSPQHLWDPTDRKYPFGERD